MKCIDVENAIVEGMREWLAAYKIQIESGKPVNTDQTDTALDAVIGQLDQLRAQQNNLCEYLEKGVYTVEMFTRRNDECDRYCGIYARPHCYQLCNLYRIQESRLGNCFGTVSAITVNLQAIIITALLVASMFGYKHFTKKKLSPILLIVISAVAGMVIYGI